MILSHKYRFIYIRCRKTASTSIELALSRVCGPYDVITPMLAPEDEALRSQLGGHGPQNHLNFDGTSRFYGHMPAAEVRLLAGEDVWASYYKWCVERHSWDKVISHYCRRHRDPATRPPLLTFLESGGAHRAVNFRLYTIGGEVTVDHIVRYEHLALGLAQIAALLGLPAEVKALPRVNPQCHAHRPHYSAFYTLPERDFVEELFADEIALHGYRYEDLAESSRSTTG